MGARLVADELARCDQVRAGERLTSAAKYNSAAIAKGVSFLLKDDELIVRGNHSCDSNLWMRGEFTLEARHDIGTGQELTLDFALQTAVEDWAMACRCGSSHCRHVIGGGDWRRADVQVRYRDHFSTFLNLRI